MSNAGANLPDETDGLLLVAYADGELAPKATRILEDRLIDSEPLRRHLDGIRRLQEALRRQLPPAPASLDRDRRLVVIAGARDQLRPRLAVNRWARIRWLAAACLIAAMLIGLLVPAKTLLRNRSVEQLSASGPYSSDDETWTLAHANLPNPQDPMGDERQPFAKDEMTASGSAGAPASAPTPVMSPAPTTPTNGSRRGAGKERSREDLPKPPVPLDVETEDDAPKPVSDLDMPVEEFEGGGRLAGSAPAAKPLAEAFKTPSEPTISGTSDGRVEGLRRLGPAAEQRLAKQEKKDASDLKQKADAPDQAKGREEAQGGSESHPGRGFAGNKPADDKRQYGRQVQSLQDAQEATVSFAGLPPADWRAPFTVDDLVEAPQFAYQGDIGTALDLLGQTGGQMAMERLQAYSDDQPTVDLDDPDLPRGRALVITARAAGMQLRREGGDVAVVRDRRPVDPTDTFGLTREDFHAAFGVTAMSVVAQAPKLTFAFTADTASFDLAAAELAAGRAVDPASVRAEHFVNAVPTGYPAASGPEAFSLYAEAGPSPFAAGSLADRTALVWVGAVSKPATTDERRPLHLTLAIDCSGSMARPGGLARVRAGLDELLPRLGDADRIALVAFGDRARVVLPATPARERSRIAEALDALATGGATNAAEGLALAYQLAAESAEPGAESRVLLATDGATLTGDAVERAVQRVQAGKSQGITLLVLGCGDGDYRAGVLETLAVKGDGQHVYAGSDDQARGLFRDRLLPERLSVLAKDAKVQVTWNPQRVAHARLVGFEQRRLADRDFRDDSVDAGEIAQESQATALFEIVLVDGGTGPLGSASVRYLDTRLGDVRELACPLPGSLVQGRPSPRLRLAACAADLAELLGRSWWANQRCSTYAGLIAELDRCEPSPVRDRLRAMADAARRLTHEP